MIADDKMIQLMHEEITIVHGKCFRCMQTALADERGIDIKHCAMKNMSFEDTYFQARILRLQVGEDYGKG
jgi:hypothetical protein